MISVSNVTMRYGAKVLFEDVSTTFTPGRRYGLTGPNGAGKTTFMKILSGDLDPQKGNVVRPRKLRRPAPGPVRLRRLPRHRHGHHGQQAASGPPSKSASSIYAKPEMTDDDGMRLGELEGIVGEEDGYTAEATPPSCCRASTSPTSCTSAK